MRFKSALEFFKVIFRYKSSMVGFFILLFFILLATVGPLVVPLDMTVNFERRFMFPSLSHLLGTDFVGRDTFAQVVHGSRDVISLGLVSASMSIAIGLVIGAVSGFAGKAVDAVLTLVTNVFLTIPAFPLMLILAVSLNVRTVWAGGFILACVSWGGVARVIRGKIIALKYSEYVLASRIMGLSMWYIIFKEMLPNTISLLTIQFIGLFQGAIAASMGLMLLGALAYRPTNWGVMLTMALQNTGVAYNNDGLIYFFTPIVCLALLQLGCLFFASGVDKAFDPRLRTE